MAASRLHTATAFLSRAHGTIGSICVAIWGGRTQALSGGEDLNVWHVRAASGAHCGRIRGLCMGVGAAGGEGVGNEHGG